MKKFLSVILAISLLIGAGCNSMFSDFEFANVAFAEGEIDGVGEVVVDDEGNFKMQFYYNNGTSESLELNDSSVPYSIWVGPFSATVSLLCATVICVCRCVYKCLCSSNRKYIQPLNK